MDESRIELIRRGYAAFNDRDLGPFDELVHPEFELDFSGSVGPERGTYAGERGLRQLFTAYWDSFESISIEPERFLEVGEAIVALVVARGRGAGSGAEVVARGPHLWWFRDGRIAGFAVYQELDQALEAARDRGRISPRRSP